MPPVSISNILIVLAWSIVLLWLAGFFWTRRCLRLQKFLVKIPEKQRAAAEPLVSVLVPVRNEAERILAKSISSLIKQTYQNYELIVLNDRSTDQTGEILRELEIQDPKSKIQNLTGAEPEPGWLGKPHALEQAYERAGGVWILTTDADVIFAPEALQTAVSYAESKNLDALTLMPKHVFGSFWERLFMPVFGWFGILAMPQHRVNDPHRPESMGIGNFFLFRRTVLEELGGFEIVRNEIAEDLKLAELLKQKGYAFRLEYAPDLLETRMYRGFWEIWSGFSKNFFPAMKYSVLKTVFSSLAILLFGVLPVFFAALSLFFGNLALFAPLFLVYALQIAVFIFLRRKLGENVLYALLTPLGLLMFQAILLNSLIRILTGKGVSWKGRSVYQKGGIRPPGG